MPTEKTSALAKLSPKDREKVLTLAAEMTLANAILKRRAARQAKLREEIATERQKKRSQEQARTNSPSETSPKQS